VQTFTLMADRGGYMQFLFQITCSKDPIVFLQRARKCSQWWKCFAKLTTNFLSTSNPALTFVNIESIDDGSACTQGVSRAKRPSRGALQVACTGYLFLSFWNLISLEFTLTRICSLVLNEQEILSMENRVCGKWAHVVNVFKIEELGINCLIN